RPHFWVWRGCFPSQSKVGGQRGKRLPSPFSPRPPKKRTILPPLHPCRRHPPPTGRFKSKTQTFSVLGKSCGMARKAASASPPPLRLAHSLLVSKRHCPQVCSGHLAAPTT